MTKHTIHLITHDACLRHNMGDAHPESAARLEAIYKELATSPLSLRWHTARKIGENLLLQAHAKEHIERIKAVAPSQEYYFLGPDVTMNPATLDAARYAAGSIIDAVDLVYRQKTGSVFCLVRPPGHHAEYHQPMGFCFFNNLACGVLYALNRYEAARVAIVDFDVHHGNGTQDILKNHSNVLFCSSFQHPFYPFSPVITDHPTIIHLPLSAGTRGNEYRQRFEDTFLSRLQDYNPEILFVSAGFDAHRLDPIGGLNLAEDDYFWLGETLARLANTCCNGRIISTLEGGYHLRALANSTHSYLTGISQACQHIV
ncbi:histone deacetylase family protein [Legionella spiritensis]|uniref:histone deacetylase family protein n=1 Tax=Legionella spiritensis TaxID=452 RepID=UPI000F6BB95A|nr:histone deacetylase family protein [Legionella spiritensis]VEG90371.1 Histone deacetylase-like amidohydrolase [Legionella spiritensis]